MENLKRNYQRFNRQEVFTSQDSRLVFNLIDEAESLNCNDSLVNMLFGLFDGYFYNDIQDKLMESPLPTSMLVQLDEVLDRVQMRSIS